MKKNKFNDRNRKQKRIRTRKRISAVLAILVAVMTYTSLMLPAISLEETVAESMDGFVMESAPEEPAPAPDEAEILVPETVESPVTESPEALVAEPVLSDTDPVQDDPYAPAAEVTPAESEEAGDSTPQIDSPDAEAGSGTPQTDSPDAAGGEAEPTETEPENTQKQPADETDAAAAEEENSDPAEEDTGESEEEEEPEVTWAESPLVYEGADYIVRMYFDESAGLPSDAVLSSAEYGAGTDLYLAYQTAVETALTLSAPEKDISRLRLFTLNVTDGAGARIFPAESVDVQIEYRYPTEIQNGEECYAVSFRRDDGLPLQAAIAERNTDPVQTPAVMVENGTVRGLCLLSYPAYDFHTEPVIGLLGLTRPEETETIELVTEEDGTEEAADGLEEDESETDEADGSETGVEFRLTTQVMTASGEVFDILVTGGPEAGVPEGAMLQAEEITEAASEYEEYREKTEDALGWESGSASYVRFFDIRIVDENGEKIEIAAPVNVEIHVAAGESSEEIDTGAQIVHFADERSEGEIVENVDIVVSESDPEVQTDSGSEEVTLAFEAEGFSVYAIASTIIEKNITTGDGHTYKVTVTYGPDAGIPEGADLLVSELTEEHEEYDFYVQQTAETVNTEVSNLAYIKLLDIVILDENGGRVTLDAPVDVKIQLLDMDEPEGEKEETTQVVHFVENEDNVEPELLDNTTDGDMISFRTDGFSVYGVVTYGTDDLVNKTLGLINTKGGTKPSGIAMMSSATGNNKKLVGKSTTVRINTVDRTNYVYVAENSDITMWTFTEAEGGKFLISATLGGAQKYLKISSDGISLSDDPNDPDCKITATAGTGNNVGKYKFSTGNGVLRVNGSNFERANSNYNSADAWQNLAELSSLTDVDFVTYTAHKTTVSGDEVDEEVHDGDLVILYTRIWNDEQNKYDYYVVDYDGKLVMAYESGDTISWVGSRINTMLWDFTEYYYPGTVTPNGYYELKNDYSGLYIAPRTSNGQETFLSNGTIGIKLNGRDNGEYYTTILAWDGYYYASLKVNEQTKELLSSTVSQASDFYFAKMSVDMSTATVSTVSTVDNNQHGIVLKMQDFGEVNSSTGRSKEMNDVLGNTPYNQWTGTKDLLLKYIVSPEDPDQPGYPQTNAAVTGVTQQSLSSLFNNTLTVNNQFLTSTYKETGYFEYDSTRNFCHLITSADDKWYGILNPNGVPYGIGDFVVYDQLATSSEGNKDTLRHGQFFPYNDLVTIFQKDENGEYIKDEDGNLVAYSPQIIDISTKYQNTTDIHADPLSSLDPAFGAPLYEIKYDTTHALPKVDHFFGMEMSASFMQTENGVDSWGHDLIFEFSGDDDFWLYVDDVLVLDLGGIHSALDGSINFRTGQIIENKIPSTLLERFENAYHQQYPNATDEDVQAWLEGIFKVDENGQLTSVFKDYTSHTMRMFYLERGGGASNIHMRFNLAEYKAGKIQLEKKVSGAENSKEKFPYQIWYKIGDVWTKADGSISVIDSQTNTAVDYEPSYEVTKDGNTLVYKDVFFVQAGQTVSILLPGEDTEYFIKECGIDYPDTYDLVKINDVPRDGSLPTSDFYNGQQVAQMDGQTVPDNVDQYSKLLDFISDTAKVANRKKVTFENHVDANAQRSLTITKKLWQDVDRTIPVTCDEDPTTFSYRVYIGTENGQYTTYNQSDYRIKDSDGNYCYATNDGYVSTGCSNFDELNDVSVPPEYLLGDTVQQRCTFQTGYGSISNIPAGYTIEIPGLMNGTVYMVVERERENPAGYDLLGYTFDDPNADSLINEVSSQEQVPDHVITGSVSEHQEVYVHNQHGYTLSVNKVWSDADFMSDHDEIYFAVYRNNNGTLSLIPDTVRQLGKTDTSIRWFFPELEAGVESLNDYEVYEIMLKVPDGTQIVVDSSGIVKYQNEDGIVSITDDNIQRISEGGTLITGGTGNEHGYTDNISYSVEYEREHLEPGIDGKYPYTRTDIVKNARPGIKIVKTDLLDNPLEGAQFALSYVGEEEKQFTSLNDGLVAVAYLTTDKVYTLKEVSAPYGYQSLIDAVGIKVDSSGKVYVNCTPDSDDPDGWSPNGWSQGDHSDGYYTIVQVDHPTAENMPAITIRNKSWTLQAVKVDSSVENKRIEGVKFELYKEVLATTNGLPDPTKPMPDYRPMEGYESLITDGHGIIPKIVMKNPDHPDGLEAGTYYLHEAQTPIGYRPLDVYIRITISPTGEITLQQATRNAAGTWTISDISSDIATVALVPDSDILQITVKNTPTDEVRIKKVSAVGQKQPLSGVKFELYRMNQIENGKPKQGETPLVSGQTDENGIMDLGGMEAAGYYLFETETVSGYNMLPGPVSIIMREQGDIYAYLNGPLDIKSQTLADGTKVWEITVENNPGIALPNTGGPGTRIFRILGITMLGFAGVCLVMRRKRIRI